MKNEKTNGKHGNDGKHNSHSSQKSHQPVQPQPAPPRSHPRATAARRLSNAAALSESRDRSRRHHSLCPQVSLQRRSNDRPDDSVRSDRKAEHFGREQSRDDVQGNRNQTDQRWPRQSGRVVGRFSETRRSARKRLRNRRNDGNRGMAGFAVSRGLSNCDIRWVDTVATARSCCEDAGVLS